MDYDHSGSVPKLFKKGKLTAALKEAQKTGIIPDDRDENGSPLSEENSYLIIRMYVEKHKSKIAENKSRLSFLERIGESVNQILAELDDGIDEFVVTYKEIYK